MEVEGTVSLEESFPTLVIPEHIEEPPFLEESISIPFVHMVAVGSTKDLQILEHPPVVQEGLDVINTPVDARPQPEEIPEASLPVQEGDEAVQLPYTESGEILVLMETVDPSK